MAIPAASLVAVAVVITAVLLFLVVLLVCRPWRLFSSPVSVPTVVAGEADDLHQPLFSGNLNSRLVQRNAQTKIVVDDLKIQVDGDSSCKSNGFATKSKVHSSFTQGDIDTLQVSNDIFEDFQLGQTLRRGAISSWPAPDFNPEMLRDCRTQKVSGIHVKDKGHLRSTLALEVVAGPSQGLGCTRHSTNISTAPLTLGRILPGDLVLQDSEVSGKHAMITWNSQSLRWELVDMGSLNGTFLNSQPVHHPDVGSREWGLPVELADGDVIMLGSSSKISVRITEIVEQDMPAGVGVASDPMFNRRAGKKLPMEDVCFCKCPLPDAEQFGLFGIFDGHGGVRAATDASKMLPENVRKLLSDPKVREKVLSCSDAGDVLRNAFYLTEVSLLHQYEGCTATMLLVWFDQNKECIAQCANVGDSACVLKVNGEHITMTEDHRVTSLTERNRLASAGRLLKDGENRLCGLNISRMLGDKFLKEQDPCFSSEPYVSEAVHLTKTCTGFALIASDGLWDVISIKRAVQLVLQSGEMSSSNVDTTGRAEKVANYLLNEAKSLRTKDNTSVVFIDFDRLRTNLCFNK